MLRWSQLGTGSNTSHHHLSFHNLEARLTLEDCLDVVSGAECDSLLSEKGESQG